MPVQNTDKLQPRRVSATTHIKRVLYVLSTTSAPAPKAQARPRPSYLRYIEYV